MVREKWCVVGDETGLREIEREIASDQTGREETGSDVNSEESQLLHKGTNG